jgi:hypothetical protein
VAVELGERDAVRTERTRILSALLDRLDELADSAMETAP